MEPGDGELAVAPPAAPTSSRRTFGRLLRDERVTFFGAGAVNTAFAFVIFAGLQLTVGKVTSYLVVLLLAHIIGVLEAFVVYRRGVFRVRGTVFADLVRFESVYLAALGLNLALLPLLVEVGGLPVIGAQACIVVLTSVMSFFGHKHFSFRRAT